VLCSVTIPYASRALFTSLPKNDWESLLFVLAGSGFSPDEHSKRITLLRRGMTPDDWLRMHRSYEPSNVEIELKALRVPALVLHPRDYPRLPTEAPMRVSALIPDARFQLLDGADIYGNAVQGLAAIDEFIAGLRGHDRHDGERDPSGDVISLLSTRELEVLRLVAAGQTNQQIAEVLVISSSTVAKHVSSILTKTGAANRAQAAVYAKDHGLA
jgi:DNA-binding CsgD family transcriptional regulator